MSEKLINILSKIKIVPVAVFDDPDDALRITEILMTNSIGLIEITLRTGSAYKCIEEVAKKYPRIITGAGSVLSKESLKTAFNSGAKFAVSPSLDTELIDHAETVGIPFIPGIATPSELNTALKRSDIVKIFPAGQLGGASYIRSITAPFKMKDFYLMPTGGINETNCKDYLELEKVIACGMSYITDSRLIKNGDFNLIEKRIKNITSLVKDTLIV